YDRYEKAMSGVYEVQPQQTEQPQQQTVQSKPKEKSKSVQQDIDVPFSPLAGTVSEESASQVVNGKSLKDIVNGTGDIQVPLKPHGVENGIQGIPVYDITSRPEQYISEAKPYMEEEKRISREFTPKPVTDASDIYSNYSNRFSLTERGKQLSDELAGISEDIQKKYMQEFLSSDEYNLKFKQKGDELNKKVSSVFNKLYTKKIENEIRPYQDKIKKELSVLYNNASRKYVNEFLNSEGYLNLSRRFKGDELNKKANELFDMLYSEKIEAEIKPQIDKYNKELNTLNKTLYDRYNKEYQNTKEYKKISEENKAYNNEVNETFTKLYSDKINADMKPYYEAYNDEVFKRYGDRIKSETTNFAKQSVKDHLTQLSSNIEKDLEESQKQYRVSAGEGGNLMLLNAAKNLTEETQKIVAEAGKKGKTGILSSLGRGISDATTLDNWSFGLVGAVDSRLLQKTIDKYERGEQLNEAEQALLDASATNMAVNAYFSSDLSRAYKAGQVMGQSIPFMLEFAVNPISATGNAMAKSILLYGLKRFGSKAVNKATKFAARLTTDAIAAAGMTATTGLARVAEGTIDRQTGNVKFDFDENGKLVYAGREGQMGFGEALGKSFASTAIENQSEMVFGAFSGIGSKIWKTIEKYIPGGVAGIMDNAIMGKAGDIYHKVFSNPVAAEAMKRAQFHGLVGEYMEEMYSNLAHIPLGEMTLEEAIDLDNNIDIIYGLAPISVAFAAIGLGGLAKEKVQNRKRLNAAINNATEVERKRIEELQQLVKNGGGNEDIKSFIKRIIASNEFTAEQKKNVIRAAFITAQNKAVEEIEDARDKELKENYAAAIEEGSATYMMHKPEEMRQTVLRREVAEQRLLESDFTPEDIQDIKNTPVEERNRILSEFDDADIKKITDFFNAYDREESLNYTLDKAHELEVDEARSHLKDITLPNNTVTIVPLGQYGTEQAQYGIVVSGIDAQGNPTQSNGAVVTYPVQMVNGTPDFSTIDKDNPIVAIPKSYTDAMVFSPDEAFNGMLTAYQQDAAILEGTPIVPGAQFPVMLDDGSMQNITVAGTAPTGESVVVLPDGKTVNMPADELSMRKRNAEIAPIMAEYAEEEQIQQQAVQEAEVAGYSPETLKSKPFKDEELIINGQKAYVTDYVEGPENLESVTVAFFDGKDSGGTPLRVESITAREYY
ncbi:MAG: hypothetical protein ACI4TD_01950, partial [Phocaeicola sp.]